MKDGGGRKQGAASPCAACKLLRRRCAQDCVFAPYFPADEPQKFANVHKVFGASNVNKMLQDRSRILETVVTTTTAMRQRRAVVEAVRPLDQFGFEN